MPDRHHRGRRRSTGAVAGRAQGGCKLPVRAPRRVLDRAEKARPRTAGGGIIFRIYLAVIARLDWATQYSVTVVDTLTLRNTGCPAFAGHDGCFAFEAT